jgi:hypothetical protein
MWYRHAEGLSIALSVRFCTAAARRLLVESSPCCTSCCTRNCCCSCACSCAHVRAAAGAGPCCCCCCCCCCCSACCAGGGVAASVVVGGCGAGAMLPARYSHWCCGWCAECCCWRSAASASSSARSSWNSAPADEAERWLTSAAGAVFCALLLRRPPSSVFLSPFHMPRAAPPPPPSWSPGACGCGGPAAVAPPSAGRAAAGERAVRQLRAFGGATGARDNRHTACHNVAAAQRHSPPAPAAAQGSHRRCQSKLPPPTPGPQLPWRALAKGHHGKGSPRSLAHQGCRAAPSDA